MPPNRLTRGAPLRLARDFTAGVGSDPAPRSPIGMQIRLLGAVEASLDEQTVPLGAPQQRAVFAMLALEANRVVPADRLIDGVWGERAPASARKLVQLYISHLRRALDGDGAVEILTRGRGYELRIPSERVDAVRFEQLVASSDGGAARTALGLWSGPPVADLGDEPFVDGEVRRLEELRVRAVERATEPPRCDRPILAVRRRRPVRRRRRPGARPARRRPRGARARGRGRRRRCGAPRPRREDAVVTQRRLRPALALAGAAALAAPASAGADAVTDWNANANAAIFATNPTAHAGTLSTAMVQGAVYDAVNAIARTGRPYLVAPPAEPWFSQDAAAATAAFRVASALVPEAQRLQLQQQYDATRAAIPDGPAEDGGAEVGELAARAMLDDRAGDGRGTPFPVVPGTQPGAWRLSPPLFATEPTPWVGNVRPFLVHGVEWLRTRGPHPLTSRAYARDLAEVQALGSLTSTARTPDQTRAAIFWQAQPGALFGGVMRSLADRYGLSTGQRARLYASVSLASADAAIGCWNDKYHWFSWRPIDAIRHADEDGNPATVADPAWTPLFDPATPTTSPLSTPAFPEHPSGHACVTAAAMGSMRAFFHTDDVPFDVTSARFPGEPRHFERFSDAVREVIDARIWAGSTSARRTSRARGSDAAWPAGCPRHCAWHASSHEPVSPPAGTQFG